MTARKTTPSYQNRLFVPGQKEILNLKSRTAVITLCVLGLVLISSGFIITTQDYGSCPATQLNASCYHTFPGTSIYITPTGDAVLTIGIVSLLSGVAILAYRQLVRAERIKG